MLDELIILEKNVKDIKEARLIIWGDIHIDNIGRILYRRINDKYLKNGDTMTTELSEREDKIAKMSDGREIVSATWDNAELRKQLEEVTMQGRRIENEVFKHPEKASALKKEYRGCVNEFRRLTLERMKGLGTHIKDRMTRFPDSRLSVLLGLNHILDKRDRKELNLNQYPHVVFISRHPPHISLKAAIEYDRKPVDSKSKTDGK